MEHKTIKERLRWWAWKFCGKGEHEDAASDAMTAGLERIEELEAKLREVSGMLYEKDLYQIKDFIDAVLEKGKTTSSPQ